MGTSGRKGLTSFLCSSRFQSILLRNGWYLISSMPLKPSLFSGFLWISLLMKFTLSLLHPYGGISSNCTCLAIIFSLISLRFAPRYGLYFNRNLYLSSHELICNHSKGKIIYTIRMIHLANDLRRHVTRCPTGILCIVRLHLSRYSHISYPYISALIEHQVFWF